MDLNSLVTGFDIAQTINSRTKRALVAAPGGQPDPMAAMTPEGGMDPMTAMTPQSPMDPMAMGGGAPPMDPAMMGMDPAMMGGGMDPSMMAAMSAPPGQPPPPMPMEGDPAAATGGAPGQPQGESKANKKKDDLVYIQQEIGATKEILRQVLEGQEAIMMLLSTMFSGGDPAAAGGGAPPPPGGDPGMAPPPPGGAPSGGADMGLGGPQSPTQPPPPDLAQVPLNKVSFDNNLDPNFSRPISVNTRGRAYHDQLDSIVSRLRNG